MTAQFDLAQLEVLTDKNAVAAAVASKLVAQIKLCETHFTIALSGGSTPKALFSELANNHADGVDWQRVKFFWLGHECSLNLN